MSPAFLIVIVVLFLVMWMFLIRPQKRRQLERQQLLDNVRVGDEIITAGGLYGRVVRVGADELTVEIAPGTNVRVARGAIASIAPAEVEAEEELDEAEETGDVESGEPTRR